MGAAVRIFFDPISYRSYMRSNRSAYFLFRMLIGYGYPQTLNTLIVLSCHVINPEDSNGEVRFDVGLFIRM